jgi:ferric iron reductase protein FhuF
MTLVREPLADTLGRLTALGESYRALLLTTPDETPGWLPVNLLAASSGPHLAEVIGRVEAYYKMRAGRAPAAFWFSRYAFTLAAVPVACYLSARRVPTLNPNALWVRFEEDGDIGGAVWGDPQVIVLAEDPASDLSQCRVAGSTYALRTVLRDELAEHFRLVIGALLAQTPLGPAGLWALAADSVAMAFVWVAGLLGDEAWGAQEAQHLAAGPSPLRRKHGFIRVEQAGLNYHLLDRTSCCLYYKSESGTHCSNCPHRPRSERVRLIEDWLTERAAQ